MNIKELAKLANVSASTVSLIMNNKCDNISQSTKEKVLEIAEQNNYIPYSKAISKALTKSKLIGIVVPDIASTTYSLLIKNLEQIISENGYATIVKSLEVDGKVNLDILISKRVECIVGFDIAFEEDDKDKLLNHNITFFSFYVNLFMHKGEYSNVNIAKAMNQGIKYMKKKGFDQIALFVDRGNKDIIRLFQEEMENNQKTVDTSLIFEVDDLIEGDMEVFLNTGVKAVFVENSHLAKRIYQYAFSKKISIPEEISLIAFDFQGNADEFIPPLCAYQLPYRNIARYVKDSIFQKSSEPLDNQKLDMVFHEGKSVLMNISNSKASISVVGGINLDIIFQIDNIPKSSESMLIKDRTRLPGGKAANQAIGVSMMGGRASIISALGNDKNGKELYNNLIKNGVDVSGVVFEDAVTTSEIYIFVSSTAEYFYGEYPEISYTLNKTHIDKHIDKILSSKYCLIQQSGISNDTVEYVGQICRKYKINMILKPSGENVLSDSVLDGLFMIVPNRTEINRIIAGNASEQEKADVFIQKGVKNVVLTLGGEGCYYTNGKIEKSYPAIDVIPIDMTGASDAFISALAVYIAEGNSLDMAIENANIVAGICTTRLGSQPSIPERNILSLYQKKYNA